MKIDPRERPADKTEKKNCPKCDKPMTRFQYYSRIRWKCFACGHAIDIDENEGGHKKD